MERVARELSHLSAIASDVSITDEVLTEQSHSPGLSPLISPLIDFRINRREERGLAEP